MKIKRLLAFVISVAMIVGMVPTFVFAKELDFEADEPVTTEAVDAEEEEKEEEEPEEKEEADESADEAESEAEEENAPVEEFVIGEDPSSVPSSTDVKAALGGKIGKSKVYWSLSGSTLTVYGKGKMPAWKSADAVPWHSHRSSIKYVYVRAGVSSIGNYAFCDIKLTGGRISSYASGKIN